MNYLIGSTYRAANNWININDPECKDEWCIITAEWGVRGRAFKFWDCLIILPECGLEIVRSVQQCFALVDNPNIRYLVHP